MDSICNSSSFPSIINDLFALSSCYEVIKFDDPTSMKRLHLAQLQTNFNVFNALSVSNAYITLGLNYFHTFLSVPFLFLVFQTWKKLSQFLEKFIFRENNFREFLV